MTWDDRPVLDSASTETKPNDTTPGGPPDDPHEGRRALLKALAVSGGYAASRVLLPALWTTPAIASLALPAHAESSCAPVSNAPEQGSKPTATVDSTTKQITLTFTYPDSLKSARDQFSICEEKVGGTRELLAMGVPNTLPTAVHQLTRTPGKYRFQFRWSTGQSPWVDVEVK